MRILTELARMHHVFVTYLVFAQTDDATLPVEQLIVQARAHFDGQLSAAPAAVSAAILFSYRAQGNSGDFSVTSCPSLAPDVARAREADRIAPSGGLADLAARCKRVWTVEPLNQPAEWLVLDFLALLASVALGPILPSEEHVLLGVRSARERSSTLRGGLRLMR